MVCANLAKDFDLPMAPFLIVNIPDNIFSATSFGEKDLGIGRRCYPKNRTCRLVSVSIQPENSISIKMDILAFD
jgi:hypothetical protein